jgi:hypothetical protein
LPADDQQAAEAVCRILAGRGILNAGPYGDGDGI